MEVKTRAYTVDDVWEILCQPGGDDRYYELINGELIEMAPPTSLRAWLLSEICGYIRDFAKPLGIGFVFVEGGYSPADDRTTLLAPDVSFVRRERTPFAANGGFRRVHARSRRGSQVAKQQLS